MKKQEIPELFKPFYNTEKSYIVKLTDAFTDEEWDDIKRAVFNLIDSDSPELSAGLSDDSRHLIIQWIRENKEIKIKGIAWIRAFARMIKQYGIKNIDSVNNTFAGILKQRAVLLNGDALKIYVTRPGDSKDPYHRNSTDSDDWGNGGSCWYSDHYTYHLTYDELLAAGELYAVLITNPAHKLIYRFWALREESAPDAMAFFNCYRDGERSDGWEDYKILASNLNSPILFKGRFNANGLYINDNVGYIMTHHTLIKNQEIIRTRFNVYEERSDESIIGTCYHCENDINEEDNYQEINGELYCDNCFSHCRKCDEYYPTADGHTHECPECEYEYNPEEFDNCPHCAEHRYCTECAEDYYISDGHFHVCECGKRFDIGDIDDCPNVQCLQCRNITRENQIPLPEYPAGLIPGKFYRWSGLPAESDRFGLVPEMQEYMNGHSFKCLQCSPFTEYGFAIRFSGDNDNFKWENANVAHFIESESIPENEEN